MSNATVGVVLALVLVAGCSLLPENRAQPSATFGADEEGRRLQAASKELEAARKATKNKRWDEAARHYLRIGELLGPSDALSNELAALQAAYSQDELDRKTAEEEAARKRDVERTAAEARAEDERRFASGKSAFERKEWERAYSLLESISVVESLVTTGKRMAQAARSNRAGDMLQEALRFEAAGRLDEALSLARAAAEVCSARVPRETIARLESRHSENVFARGTAEFAAKNWELAYTLLESVAVVASRQRVRDDMIREARSNHAAAWVELAKARHQAGELDTALSFAAHANEISRREDVTAWMAELTREMETKRRVAAEVEEAHRVLTDAELALKAGKLRDAAASVAKVDANASNPARTSVVERLDGIRQRIYESARTAEDFESLGAYRDAPARVVQCRVEAWKREAAERAEREEREQAAANAELSKRRAEAVAAAAPALVIGLAAAFVYFLPLIVAGARQHRWATSIGVVNLFLGWTLVGWVAALAWALGPTDTASKPPSEAAGAREAGAPAGTDVARQDPRSGYPVVVVGVVAFLLLLCCVVSNPASPPARTSTDTNDTGSTRSTVSESDSTMRAGERRITTCQLFAGTTVENFEEIARLARAKDEVGVRNLMFSGRGIPVPEGTTVHIIDPVSSWGVHAGIAEFRCVDRAYAGQRAFMFRDVLEKNSRRE